MSENKELLPCPFCGSDAGMSTMTFGDSVYYRIVCYEGHYLDQWEECEEEAVKEWNTRHLPESVEKVLEAAREAEKLTSEIKETGISDDTTLMFIIAGKLVKANAAVHEAIRNHDGRK